MSADPITGARTTQSPVFAPGRCLETPARRDGVSSASFAEEVQSEFARYQHNCRDFSRYATQHPIS